MNRIGVGRREACIGAGLGAALAFAGIGHRHPSVLDLWPRARPLRWWLADRARGRVWGLDAGLFVRCALDVSAPVAVVTARGGLWIASAREQRRAGPHDLLQVDAHGASLARHALGPLRALTAGVGGSVWALDECAVGARLLHCTSGAPPVVRAELPGAVCLARKRDEVLVGAQWGELWLLDGEHLAAGAFVADGLFAAAPARRGWWVLARRRLSLIDRTLDVISERRLDFDAGCLAVARDGGAWVFGRDGPQLARFGASGGLRFERSRLCVRGFTAAQSSSGGGVLAATPTALVALDAGGALVRGQGGFDYVCSLTPAS